MRLTSSPDRAPLRAHLDPGASPRWVLPVVAIECLAIFAFDRAIDAAPVQHLYYLPIILAARYFGRAVGVIAALAAVALYHLANYSSLSHRYQESDIIQVALFVAVGLITARLVKDAASLKLLAMTDDLTGLHNLRSFEARLLGLVRASRERGLPLAMLVLDVDRLKGLNDKHGHLAGAEAVRAVGHIIAQQLPVNAVACRYGGDEFAVALPECDEGQAEAIASDLCEAVRAEAAQLVRRHWPVGTLTISIGVATIRESRGAFGTDEQEGEALFHGADDALYQAKDDGRNRVHSGPSRRTEAHRVESHANLHRPGLSNESQ